MTETRPILVAYDGSPESEAAVRAAASLFPGRRFVVASVWEPGLAVAMAPAYEPTGVGFMQPSMTDVTAVDKAQHDRAAASAEAGAAIARELGATAEPYPVPDASDVARTLAALAGEVGADAIVVGSRGLGSVKARLLGSTSSGLLHHSGLPVVVVRASG
jgi:nucleotide-binding universal stress UspA family protein